MTSTGKVGTMRNLSDFATNRELTEGLELLWGATVKKFLQRLAVAWVFVALLPSPNTGQQDKNQASTQVGSQGIPDLFIGIWKLHTGKPFNELITIESQGVDYKFTYDQSTGKGKEYHWSYITHMKGDTVQPVQMNGQPMASKIRITRIDSSTYRVEGDIQKDVYRVSSDGQTMKLHRTYLAGIVVGTTRLQDETLLFDRQK